MTNEQKEKYIDYLKKHVKPKRLAHSMGVAQTAKDLAMQYGADPDKAEEAGILHDCSKGLSYDEMLKAAEHYGVPVDAWQREAPELLHPYVSACIAEKELGVNDPEVLQAIRRHMCGAPDMTILDAVVNLADYIEPTRDYPDVEEMREMAKISLWETLCECLKRTMILTLSEGLITHPDTLNTYNTLKLKLSHKGEHHD